MDTPDPQDPRATYAALLRQFNSVSHESRELSAQLHALGETLAYYHRLNHSLLRLLDEYAVAPLLPDPARIQAIVSRAPRLADCLLPALQLLSHHNPPVSSSHLLNLITAESVPDLVADDLSSVSVDPLSLEAWVEKRCPHLIPGDFAPLTVPTAGVVPEYSGTEWNVDMH